MTVTVTKPAFNLRETLTKLGRKMGLKGAEVLAAETVDDVYNVIGTNRNILINGNFRISQRGDFTAGENQLNTSQYYVDRWKCYRAVMNGTVRFISATINNESLTSVRFTATNTASGELLLEQIVESSNIVVGKTYTYSAWVKSKTKNVKLRLYKGDDWIESKSHSGSGEWEKLSLTYIARSSSANYSHQLYCSSQINGDIWEFALPQLEVGLTATPFEHRPYGLELQLCQRYLHRINANENANFDHIAVAVVTSTTNARAVFRHPVELRTTPALSFSDVSHFIIDYHTGNIACSSISADRLQKYESSVNVNVASGMTAGDATRFIRNSSTSNVWIQFSAEL